jgi:integrase
MSCNTIIIFLYQLQITSIDLYGTIHDKIPQIVIGGLIVARKKTAERKAITAWHLETFDPKGKRREFFDAPLAYRTSQRGVGTFFTLYRTPDGVRRRVSLGKHPGISLTEAKAVAFSIQARVGKGEDPAAKPEQPENEKSFSSLAKVYLARKVTGMRSEIEIRRIYNTLLIPRFGAQDISEITLPEIATFLDHVVDRRGPVSANRVLAQLRAGFSWLQKRGHITMNPAAGIPRPGGAETPRERVLSDTEIAAVWAAPDSVFKSFVQIALLTGQRRTPVASMKWEDLELDGDEPLWTIPREDMKAGRGHFIPLSPQAVAIIRSILKGGPFVFGLHGDAPFSGFSKSLERLRLATDTNGWTLHDLRRSAVTRMAEYAGAETLRHVLDHKPPANDLLARVYNQKRDLGEARVALNSLGCQIDNIANEEDADNVAACRRQL